MLKMFVFTFHGTTTKTDMFTSIMANSSGIDEVDYLKQAIPFAKTFLKWIVQRDCKLQSVNSGVHKSAATQFKLQLTST